MKQTRFQHLRAMDYIDKESAPWLFMFQTAVVSVGMFIVCLLPSVLLKAYIIATLGGSGTIAELASLVGDNEHDWSGDPNAWFAALMSGFGMLVYYSDAPTLRNVPTFVVFKFVRWWGFGFLMSFFAVWKWDASSIGSADDVATSACNVLIWTSFGFGLVRLIVTAMLEEVDGPKREDSSTPIIITPIRGGTFRDERRR